MVDVGFKYDWSMINNIKKPWKITIENKLKIRAFIFNHRASA